MSIDNVGLTVSNGFLYKKSRAFMHPALGKF